MPSNKEHRYILDPTKGTATKTTCPHCHGTKCFKRYIDRVTGLYLADDCGRCDHEHNCGYHYTAGQWLKDHAWQRSPSPSQHTSVHAMPKVAIPTPVYVTFPMWMVEKRHADGTVFMTWLYNVIDNPDVVGDVYEKYMIGMTMTTSYKTPAVIFWYIDSQGIVHDGKMMWYKSDGHREQMVNWISSRMRNAGKIASNAETQKCLFGEHLLPTRPNASVAIVESEKTALVCACRYPKYIWLATGGCGGLNADKMKCLTGRRVIIFPDSGKLEEWRNKLSSVQSCSISFYEGMEQYPPNTDIADVLLDKLLAPPSAEATATAPPTAPVEPQSPAEIAWAEMCSDNPALKILEATFDLSPIEGPCPF